MTDGPGRPLDLALEAARFDALLDSATSEKYGSLAEDDFDEGIGLIEIRWRITDFLDAASASTLVADEDALETALFKAVDLKLQLYVVLDTLGLINRDYYDVVNAADDGLPTPRTALRLLGLRQALIGQERVLFERVMNLIYFLGTGTELPRGSNKRSKTTAFFDWVDNSETWDFLAPHREHVQRLDDAWRTPEFHKASRLRALLLRGEIGELTGQLRVLTIVSNVVWENTLDVLRGVPVTRRIIFPGRPTRSEPEAPRDDRPDPPSGFKVQQINLRG